MKMITTIYTMLIKEATPSFVHIKAIIFNHWKTTANVTYGTNIRALLPQKKPRKPDNIIKGHRPLSVEEVLWKLHQMIISTRIQTT